MKDQRRVFVEVPPELVAIGDQLRALGTQFSEGLAKLRGALTSGKQIAAGLAAQPKRRARKR